MFEPCLQLPSQQGERIDTERVDLTCGAPSAAARRMRISDERHRRVWNPCRLLM
jgi:hypothetical protein